MAGSRLIVVLSALIVHGCAGAAGSAVLQMPGMREMPGMTGRAVREAPKMQGEYGPYPMSREASGTSWQPDSAPPAGPAAMHGAWIWMAHGWMDGIGDSQGGSRGAGKIFAASMVGAMAVRPFGPAGRGTLGIRAMISLDPAMIGRSGYPLLLQTGETADGRTPLIDRQHPHDFFTELAASAAWKIGRCRSLFVYGGLPGEPAIGPAAYPHRFSAMELPEAPVSHHWLDSTHITFGVVTAGVVDGNVKLEVSAFRGREPDAERWKIERPRLDSRSLRLSWNPNPRWALQGSFARIRSPEQLRPEEDTRRFTISGTYQRRTQRSSWQSTFAWGMNRNEPPGEFLNALLIESALDRGRHTFLARIERVEKDDLIPPGARGAGDITPAGKLSLGYVHDLRTGPTWRIGIGVLGSAFAMAPRLRTYYGTPVAGMLWLRVRTT